MPRLAGQGLRYKGQGTSKVQGPRMQNRTIGCILALGISSSSYRKAVWSFMHSTYIRFMNSKPLVILGSARKGSDTLKFLELIFADLDHTLVDLLDYKISGYHYPHHYSEDDQYDQVVNELLQHELVVFATPVYWYSMSSLMKTFFDRFSDLVTYKKTIGRKLKGKSTALITVGAEEKLPEGFEIPFSCTSSYLDMEYLGSIYHCVGHEAYNKSSVAKFREKLKRH